jgi:inositol-phosphate phosphatase / L-galactose 1-phosphate phosphatase / histidinol-phosphatase
MLNQSIKDLALSLADAARNEILPLFKRQVDVEYKVAASPIVTVADRNAERAMRDIIEKRAPDHGIIGEEFGVKESSSPYTWILDPVDGTIAFATGKPLFGTLIALLKEDEFVLGIIDQPVLSERWLGVSGEKTTLNDKPVSTKANPDLAKAFLSITSPYMLVTDDQKRKFEVVHKSVHVTSFGGDCYQYGLLASGDIDIVIEAGLALHDYAALTPIIEGAGGVVTDWNGQPLNRNSSGEVLVTANEKLHKSVLSLFNGSS